MDRAQRARLAGKKGSKGIVAKWPIPARSAGARPSVTEGNQLGLCRDIVLIFTCRGQGFWARKLGMAKKTGMSDSSLWIIAIVLVLVAAWTFFKR